MLQKYIPIINNNKLYVYFMNIKYQHWSYFAFAQACGPAPKMASLYK